MTVLYIMKSVFNLDICQLMWQKWMQLQVGQVDFYVSRDAMSQFGRPFVHK